ncbi:hypothetical protein HC024_21090 [Methylococcaceae bacterium WWC4]|nr:hypothetical protein [Methylococcaceae bacterium WWC4]
MPKKALIERVGDAMRRWALYLFFLIGLFSRDGYAINCVDKTFSEGELSSIVASYRLSNKDVPSAFEDKETRVVRVRCNYQYFEYKVPNKDGFYHLFEIDQFGEVINFYVGKPY